jgi:hypothetical protein
MCQSLGGDYQGNGTACYSLTDVPEVNIAHSLHVDVHPNPFNPAVDVAFVLDGASAGPVTVELVDLSGRIVRRLLVNAPLSPGRQCLRWDGRDSVGRDAAAGVYFVKVTTRAGAAVAKIALIK